MANMYTLKCQGDDLIHGEEVLDHRKKKKHLVNVEVTIDFMERKYLVTVQVR